MHTDLNSSARTLVRRKNRTRFLFALLAVILLALSSYTFIAAQTTGLVTQDLAGGTLTAEDLAGALVGSSGDVTISNVQYTGAKVAAGTFSGGTGIVGFESGIILSTGNIAGVVGPNGGTASTTNSQPGDDDLSTLASTETKTRPTLDAAVLTFDFVPNGDNVYFNFVFSSDEYNEFVNTDFNDVFAFYVNGENCALVEGEPVSINTINNGNSKPDGDKTTSNPELYRNNVLVDDTSPINTGMDGLTVVLNCGAAVKPGETNTMKLAIADTNDSSYDSNVFIEAGSLTTIPPTPTPTTVAPPTPTATPAPECKAPPTNSRGDVHIFTPDGLVYDFQEAGDFLSVQSSDGAAIVQARQQSLVNNPRISVNVGVAFWVDGDKVEFYVKPESAFYVNDELTDLPTSTVALPSGGSIELLAANDYLIAWPGCSYAARLVIHGTTLMDYGFVSYQGDTLTYEGFLGNLDGNPKNDLTTSDGEVIAPPPSIANLKRFGDSWRVPDGESLLRDFGGDTPEIDATVLPITMGEIDDETRGEAEATCLEAGISDPLAIRDCTYDVAVTGDPIFIESAKVFEESTKDIPPSAKVSAQPGETLSGNIFDANQAVRSGISILDGDDLIITSGKLADGTGYIRFNIYRDGLYVASYSVSTDAAVADALTGAAFATMELPVVEAETGIPAEDLAMLQEAIPVCAEGLFLLADNMYEYPDAADVYGEAYQFFAQEYLPGCEAVGSFVSTYAEGVGAFFDEVGFSFEEFVASDGYSKATWSDTIGTITNIGTRVPQYCPNAHLTQYDCVKASERSLVSIDAALPALDLLYAFSEQ